MDNEVGYGFLGRVLDQLDAICFVGWGWKRVENFLTFRES